MQQTPHAQSDDSDLDPRSRLILLTMRLHGGSMEKEEMLDTCVVLEQAYGTCEAALHALDTAMVRGGKQLIDDLSVLARVPRD